MLCLALPVRSTNELSRAASGEAPPAPDPVEFASVFHSATSARRHAPTSLATHIALLTARYRSLLFINAYRLGMQGNALPIVIVYPSLHAATAAGSLGIE